MFKLKHHDDHITEVIIFTVLLISNIDVEIYVREHNTLEYNILNKCDGYKQNVRHPKRCFLESVKKHRHCHRERKFTSYYRH